MKLDILAIGVHPDDIELCGVGTLLKHIELGYSVGILDLTRGELGTRGDAKTRIQEAQKSAKIGDLSVRCNVGLADGFFEHDSKSIRSIIPYIRKYQPEVVLVNAVWDRHPDHARASKLARDACFYSGLQKIKSVDPVNEKIQEPWRPGNVFCYMQDYTSTPDFVVETSSYMDRKMQMIKAFGSQFYDPESTEPETPISSKDFLDNVIAKDRVMGRFIGATFGEGFHTTRPPGITDLLKLQ